MRIDRLEFNDSFMITEAAAVDGNHLTTVYCGLQFNDANEMHLKYLIRLLQSLSLHLDLQI